jgi:hydrogenase large subunit
MATRTITLDPVTRIEGHLRIDAEVDNNRVSKAWSSAQMWRGLEIILKGKEPQDAWILAQRICGVCTTVHAIASIRSVEHALKAAVPMNAHYIRGIIMGQHSVQDHIVHFYHLSAMDWIDVLSALKADPKKTAQIAQSLSDWPGNSETEFKAVKDKLTSFAGGGKLGIFSSGYWGHPAMKLSPEVNLMAVTHYLKALDYQRKAAQVQAIIGGKNPHVQNLVVGGVATAINVDNLATLNMERLMYMRTLMEETRDFVHQVYYPDLLAIADAYKEWFKYGAGVTNYLAVPEFPEDPASKTFSLPGGIITQGDLQKFRPVTSQTDEYLVNNIQESVAHAWFDGSASLHPWKGETKASYTDFKPDGKYSWCKAPRLAGQPVQVGPLAQVLACYASGQPKVKKLVDDANARLGIGLSDYHSTMGRILTRGMRACVMADLSLEQLDKLTANIASGDQTYANPVEIPSGEFQGVGFHEAPRGTLSHWMVFKDKKITNYQAVVPSTWNASPRDEQGVMGPYEAALVGNPVADPEKPLEVLRTVHSFDPCIACAVHAIDPAGNEITCVKAI